MFWGNSRLVERLPLKQDGQGEFDRKKTVGKRNIMALYSFHLD